MLPVGNASPTPRCRDSNWVRAELVSEPGNPGSFFSSRECVVPLHRSCRLERFIRRRHRSNIAAIEHAGVVMVHPKVLVTGATGRTGSVVVSQLLHAGYPVRALVHRNDARSA